MVHRWCMNAPIRTLRGILVLEIKWIAFLATSIGILASTLCRVATPCWKSSMLTVLFGVGWSAYGISDVAFIRSFWRRPNLTHLIHSALDPSRRLMSMCPAGMDTDIWDWSSPEVLGLRFLCGVVELTWRWNMRWVVWWLRRGRRWHGDWKVAWCRPRLIDAWKGDSWNNSSIFPMITTSCCRIAQDDRNHPLGCWTQLKIGLSTSKKPEELVYSRNSRVADGTPHGSILVTSTLRWSGLESDRSLTVFVWWLVPGTSWASGAGSVPRWASGTSCWRSPSWAATDGDWSFIRSPCGRLVVMRRGSSKRIVVEVVDVV